jgi:hypothetical protein
MSLPKAELVGGPLDGATVAPQTGGFVWAQAGGKGVRCFQARAAGRLLYRRAGDGKWLYAGYTHAVCSGCEGFNEVGEGERDPKCELCGSALERLPDRAA